MKRRPEWQQPSPKMQQTAVLAAIEGDLSNLCNGVYPPERLREIYQRCKTFFEQAHELNEANCRSWQSFEFLESEFNRPSKLK